MGPSGVRVGLGLLVVFALGCGSATRRVTGTVTLDGRPVPSGGITFQDVEGRLAPDHGEIKGGRFELRAKPGKKRVEVRASREVPAKKTEMGAYFEDYIPRRYNAESTLTADVTPGGANHFDFKLEGGKK
jgi:hypothetical protein